ncbi:hypothetical protein HDU97_008169, partial [Phlyctochytrium planicorne]
TDRERRFHCIIPNCDKSFFRKQDRVRHEATHMLPNQRPHQCPNGCGRSFGRADVATRHAKNACKLLWVKVKMRVTNDA